MRLLSLALLTSCLTAADLPVREVVLYASGVGYVEHAGTVTGDAEVELRFQGGQLNDVLKSLVAEDQGGNVSTAIYPSQDPLEKTLGSFQVNLAGSPTLGQVLAQLRGAPATARWQGEVLAGTILGIETRVKDLGDGRTVTQAVLSLLSGGMIRQVPLDEAAAVILEDQALQAELARALVVIAQGRDQNKRPLLLHFNGAGPRPVRVGYVIEMPLWKTSYRLVLPTKPGAPAALQGWALVDNQTDTDWRSIRLSLVSGRPIGFIQDLAKPRYRARPVIDAPDTPVPRPMTFAAPTAAPIPKGRMGRSLGVAMAQESPVSEAMDITASVHTAATTEDLGTLFRYAVEGVTLPRQRSAMIPIITETVAVEAVSIYGADQAASRHPLAGAALANTTGKHLLAGPMTVLEGGAYAGDALLGHLPPGAKRLIAYAVDLPVTIDTEDAPEQRRITTAKVAKGTMTLVSRLEARRTYRLRSEDDLPRQVVIEHTFRPGWTLAMEPAERTDAVARYRVPLAARGEQVLVVTESLVLDEQVVIADLEGDLLAAYTANGALSAPLREALTQAGILRAQVQEAEQQVRQVEAELAAITTEQGRLRDNMRTLAQTAALYQRLMTKLDEQETRIEALQAQGKTHRQTATQARTRLLDYLHTLSVE
jgi:hypothetical protein